MAQKKKSRIGAWVIVGVVLVGLAGFGSGGLSGNIRTLGSAGDKEITVTAYQRALDAQIRALSAQFGTAVSFQQAQAFGIDRQALAQVVQLRTLDHAAAQMGLSAGDMAVFEQISAISAFQGASGFDRETYRLVLQQAGQSETAFETEIREELARGLLQAAIVGGVPAPEAPATALGAYLSEARDITLARVDAATLTEPVPGPSDADLETFYTENPTLFTLPETREISYAWVTPAMILDRMDVTDLAIETLYQDRIADFVQPERRLVERLNFTDPAAAESAAARITAGEISFDALVAERGLALADVDLGDIGRDDLPGAAADAVFTAFPGAVVGPFPTPLGAALYRMNAVLAAQDIPLADVRDDLRNELAAEAARTAINDDFDRLTDLLAGGASLADLAERSDMQLGQISWTPDLADGIAAYDAFREAAAAAEQGDFPQLAVLSDGGIFALTLDAVTPPRVPPLADILPQVETAWRAQAQQAAILARAGQIAAQITPASDFAALGLAAQAETGLTRRSFVQATPPDFTTTVFALAPGETRVIDAGTGALIVRLDRIASADPAATDQTAQRDAIGENIAAGIAQDLFDAYAAALQASTEITINETTVNAVNAQLQ